MAMDASPSALVKLLLPKTPMILKTALLHTLSLSPTSSKWDLKTEITVKIIRDMIGPNGTPSPITKQQKLTTRDPGVKGKVWVSKIKFDKLEDEEGGVREKLFGAIEAMGTGEEQWTRVENHAVEAEWTGYRKDAMKDTPEPADWSEKQKYDALMEETRSRVTILYFHGGAMYLLDPATYRPTTSRLAKETGGRVLSVRYRLAPQNPFPAALLDALTAYLALLYPPPGSPHAPVPADEIVFGGDSAGGMLCVALLQLLLQFKRSAPTGQDPVLKLRGQDVAIPLPAGLALSSPWLDVTRSLPSLESLAHYDYLPSPSQTHSMHYPPDSAWPATPPRADLYCEGSALCHPLVSPLAAPDWTSSPPVFISVGQEMLRDEDAVLAKRLNSQGVKVIYREFEAMPHCFAMMLEGLRESHAHYEEYAGFCRKAVEGSVESSAELVHAKTLKRESVEFGKLSDLTEEQIRDMMVKGRRRLEDRARRGDAEARPML